MNRVLSPSEHGSALCLVSQSLSTSSFLAGQLMTKDFRCPTVPCTASPMSRGP